MNRIRRLLLFALSVLCVSAQAGAASVAEALVAKGYRLALFVAAEDSTPGSVPCAVWGRCILGVANPAIPFVGTDESWLARWGVPRLSTAGNTVGERLPDSSELACVVKRLGLPEGYQVTEADRSDLKVLAASAQGTAWDLELKSWTCTPAPACPPPAECMIPPSPCQVCPPPPPPPPPCDVCPIPCAEKSAFILQTIEKSKAWDLPTPGRLRALKAVAAWAAGCPR